MAEHLNLSKRCVYSALKRINDHSEITAFCSIRQTRKPSRIVENDAYLRQKIIGR